MARFTLPVTIFLISAIAVIGYYHLRIYRHGVLDSVIDYRVYYQAAERLDNGEEIYQEEDLPMVFKYSPSFALVMIPLTKIDLPRSVLVWYLIHLFFLVASYILVFRILPLMSRKERILTGIITLVLSFKAILGNFQLGQTNILLLFLLMLCLYGYQKKKDLFLGVPLGILMMIKLTPILFLFYFLYQRRYRSILYALMTVVVLFLMPVFYLGLSGNWQSHLAWFAMLRESTPDLLLHYKNQSMLSLLLRLLSVTSADILDRSAAYYFANVLCGFLFIFLCAFSLYMCRSKGHLTQDRNFQLKGIEFSLLILIMALFSPLAWGATFVQIMPAFFFVSCAWVKGGFKDPLLSLLLILSFLTSTATSPDLMGSTLAMWIQVHLGKTFAALCIYIGLVRMAYEVKG